MKIEQDKKPLGIIYPKIKHQFRVDIITDTLSDNEKRLLSLQSISCWIQEGEEKVNNLLTIKIEDDKANGIVSILDRIKSCDLKITYVDWNGETVVSSDTITGCKLILKRNDLTYARSEAHEYKLVYSFDKIKREPATVSIPE